MRCNPQEQYGKAAGDVHGIVQAIECSDTIYLGYST